MLGMAVGEALGAHVEFRPRSYLEKYPVENLQGGDTRGLKPGQWTDATSMALCLAISLIVKRDHDAYDQLVRYKWWWKEGYMSSTGRCFDIGNATRESLQNFIIKQKEFGKTHKISYEQMDSLSAENSERFKDEQSTSCSRDGVAGNGALMRLAPIPLFFYRSPSHAIRYAGESAILTHRDDRARDACRYYAALIAGALQGYSKTDLLDKKFYLSRKNEKWFGEGDEAELHSDIQKIAKALEAALWAFWCDDGSFKKGALQVVNLGDDTSTTAAIYGQLAGAYYGIHALPDEWSKVVHAREFILCLSEWLMHEGYKWHELCEMNKSK
ncbi:unnamed protein product [Didymodactylos carnosus]|uniref:ADP-ribosylglycohydrolase n=1 Tax=Didymodactylos carnosus TaxID=1234261 RepID=A0A8S2P3C7_9BILA|nr:unnamed protein product [Didymodactylos carnosus]CAF4033539.1 unnamed protein product [Didymodactylos carnosus]